VKALALQLIALSVILAGQLPAADLASSYEWKPVCIGAGGYADGFITSDSNPNVRFVRVDTGQFYRWSVADNRWLPMVVQNADGSGFDRALFPDTSHGLVAGANSFALDPNDNNVLYLYLTFTTYGSAACYGTLPCNVYKSTDGGKKFTATHFNDAAGFTMKNNDAFCDDSFRQDDDCMAVDPNNSKVVYIGTGTKGMFKSTDGGNTWKAIIGGGLPVPKGKNDINVLIYKKGGTTVVNGVSVSKVIYLVYSKGVSKNPLAEGNVYRSADGGQTWDNLTKDAGPSVRCRGGVLDQNSGILYVRTQRWEPGSKVSLWKYENQTWTKVVDDVIMLAIDPTNSNNLVAQGFTGGRISIDGGKTWKKVEAKFARNPGQGCAGILEKWSNGQLRMDTAGTVWMANGNNGVIKWKFDPKATSMTWVPDAAGIENQVGMDIVFLKNSGNKILVSVGDQNGFIINNPDNFDVTLVEPELAVTGYGHGISVCPNDPNTFLIDGYHPAITTDGGKTYMLKGLKDLLLSEMKSKHGWGNMKISRRGDWKAGSDHLVAVFSGAAWYSKDGGNTWTKSKTDFGPVLVPTAPWAFNAGLVADPFVPDKFYGYFQEGTGSTGVFCTTTDGGENWKRIALPAAKPNDKCELRANEAVQNDLWLEAGNGMFHSTDAGGTWTHVPGNLGLDPGRLSSIALGKGSGRSGDAPYTVYYAYVSTQRDQPAKDEGIYRSTNAGVSWDRICKRPYGFLCACGTIAASWDTFGLVCANVNGQSFIYGTLKEKK